MKIVQAGKKMGSQDVQRTRLDKYNKDSWCMHALICKSVYVTLLLNFISEGNIIRFTSLQ